MRKFAIKTFVLMYAFCCTANGFAEASEESHIAAYPQASAPCAIVIFGATGDLTARKLLPAIYNLAHAGCLSPHTAVVGFARDGHTHESFRKRMGEVFDQFSRTQPKDANLWSAFEKKLFYHQADFEDDQAYEELKRLLANIDRELGTQRNRVYYLATPPSYFSKILNKLEKHKLIYDSISELEPWCRVIIEKPFGNDLESASLLHEQVSQQLDESQIYLMDHYLGKEGVQNLCSLRFENVLLGPLWNRTFVDHVQITLSEDIGIAERARFWEETGTLRDIFQNHLMQLLAIIAMEPPDQLDAQHIHQEKIKVLNAIRPLLPEEIECSVIRGQYGPGTVKGMAVPGYKQENGVLADSTSETFVAAKLFIDNDRWQGVPFYIRGGKRLSKQTTEIVVVFKKGDLQREPNALFIRLQPNPAVYFRIMAKVPMFEKNIRPLLFGYSPEKAFQAVSSEAYEKLLYDCIKGDRSLYVELEEQLAAWRVLMPVIEHWKSHPGTMELYEAASWGPSGSDQMLSENGHHWQLLD
jgi:glucose-6-phosphate 1-dehydrogenase